MASELSRLQWIEILQNSEITRQLDLEVFQVLYSFEKQAATASQVGLILGYKGKTPQGPLNLEIGRYAKRIANEYDINFTERSSRQLILKKNLVR